MVGIVAGGIPSGAVDTNVATVGEINEDVEFGAGTVTLGILTLYVILG